MSHEDIEDSLWSDPTSYLDLGYPPDLTEAELVVGALHEKANADPAPNGGGEYGAQTGFAWTRGAAMLNEILNPKTDNGEQ